MPVLPNYDEFAGRHWETGTVRNVLAFQGIKAPHTGKPISEALLLGVSGGITVGYFTFEYDGYLPHLVLLTRNSFDPLETLFERLAIGREILQTTDAHKAETNLLEVLEGGRPALVWADMFTLPHYDLPYDEQNWGMIPVLVYGVEGDTVYLADRSNHPVKVNVDIFNQARARIKKDKFRVVALDAPDMSKLPSAVNKGIWQCINLFTEAPPKGKRDNFGLAALQHWAKMLTNTRNKQSWARYFDTAEQLWMALAGDQVQSGVYSFIQHGTGNSAERGMYADFLDESAVILGKSELKTVANLFRKSENEWQKLAEMLLPDENPSMKEAKTLLNRKRALFLERGSDSLEEIRQINHRLNALRATVATDFPMGEMEISAYREQLSMQVLKIHNIEREAVECLQSVMT